MEATFRKLTCTGYDEAKFERFVAQQRKALEKASRRDHLKYGAPMPAAEQLDKNARAMAEMYRHHFRTYE
jgi:hypothetical protein